MICYNGRGKLRYDGAMVKCPAEPDPALQEKHGSMFYTYVLKSKVNNDIYVGYCGDLKKRFSEHNRGKVKSTKGYLPWELIYYEAYKGKFDASKREKQLKNHAAKEELKKQIENSLV